MVSFTKPLKKACYISLRFRGCLLSSISFSLIFLVRTSYGVELPPFGWAGAQLWQANCWQQAENNYLKNFAEKFFLNSPAKKLSEKFFWKNFSAEIFLKKNFPHFFAGEKGQFWGRRNITLFCFSRSFSTTLVRRLPSACLNLEIAWMSFVKGPLLSDGPQ